MTDALYNEVDPYPAAWLRNLIAADHIPPGHVDERNIADLTANDVSDRAQVHFFAGIGGWNHALELAGWPAARPVWTGSCPCQPFSVAGKGLGTDDARHLWPEMRRLIGECRPPIVFGEQVAGRAGREWLAGVRADLEELGYAVGASDLCAPGAGAPHIRQRLYWGAIRLADANQRERGWAANGQGRQHDGQTTGRQQGDGFAQSSGASGWADSVWHECLDGKARRIPSEPELFPLADGVPGRVGQLRAYGNAIVPQVAATFITAFMGACNE